MNRLAFCSCGHLFTSWGKYPEADDVAKMVDHWREGHTIVPTNRLTDLRIKAAARDFARALPAHAQEA